MSPLFDNLIVNENSGLAELRASIRHYDLDIATSGPGRTKEVILADIRKALCVVDEESSMERLREFIQLHLLDIKTAGLGRTRKTVLADILSAQSKLEVNDSSSIMDLRAFVATKRLDVKTAGQGRTKETILSDIRAAMVGRATATETQEAEPAAQAVPASQVTTPASAAGVFDVSASMEALRSVIAERGLNIKTAGPGRSKSAVLADVLASSVGADSTIDELRAHVRDNGMNITTSGPGRTKAAILADIHRAESAKHTPPDESMDENDPVPATSSMASAAA